MKVMEENAETTVRSLLKDMHSKHNGRPLITNDFMDDGRPICLTITIDGDNGTADFDFTRTGTSPLAFTIHVQNFTDLIYH